MGIISKGILGPVSGTVGPVTGSSWKGKNYIRSKPAGKRKNKSEKQIAQQIRFAMVGRFIRGMMAFIDIGFKSFALNMTAFNAAFSYNLKNVITGQVPLLAIDYSRALVSRGDLPNVIAPAVALTAGGILHFTWTNNAGIGNTADEDNSMLIAYCPVMGMSVFNINGPARSQGEASLNVALLSGDEVEVYLAFRNAKGKEVSNSIYLGSIEVTM